MEPNFDKLFGGGVHVIAPRQRREQFKAETPHETDAMLQDFIKLGHRFPRLFIPVLTSRLGGYIWMVRLEHTHYGPGTDANKDFQVCRLLWQDLDWLLVSIPATDKPLAEDIAGRVGMRLADGVPTLIQRTQLTGVPAVVVGSQRLTDLAVSDVFPCSGLNTWTLENDNRNPVNNMRAQIDRQYARETEMQEAQAVIESYWRKLGRTPPPMGA